MSPQLLQCQQVCASRMWNRAGNRCFRLSPASSLASPFVPGANGLTLLPGNMGLLFPSVLRRLFKEKRRNLVAYQRSRERVRHAGCHRGGWDSLGQRAEPHMLTGEVPSYFRVSGLNAAPCNRALGDHDLGGHTRALPCFSQDGVDKFSGRAGCTGSVLGLQRYHRTILLCREINFFFIKKELELFFFFFWLRPALLFRRRQPSVRRGETAGPQP